MTQSTMETRSVASKAGINYSKRALSFCLLVIGVAALCLCARGGKDWDSSGWRDARAYRGSTIVLPTAAEQVNLMESETGRPLRLADEGRAAILPANVAENAVLRVTPKEKGDAVFDLNVSIIDRSYGIAAGALGLLLLFLLLWTFDLKLAAALSEAGGGLSLARVQLFLWFLPTFFMVVALGVPLLALPPLDKSLVALFGLAGLTTTLGTAASPAANEPQSEGSLVRSETTPAMRQIVEDWQNRLDFSRVQLLLMTLLGAFVVLAAFLGTLRVPSIPDGWLAVLGASQVAYLGTKAVKQVKVNPADQPPTPNNAATGNLR